MVSFLKGENVNLKLKAILAAAKFMKYAQQVAKAENMRKSHANKIKHHVFTNVRKLPAPKKNDVVCIMVGRNEMLRLPDALRHYRELGVDRFAFIDNLSDDGTAEYLLEQPDVDLISTASSYAEARSAVYWFEKVSLSYGLGRWIVLVDPDELLVYDGMDRHDIHDLTAFLDKRRSLSMCAPLIDMYSDLPIHEVRYERGDRMMDCCRYFDGDYTWYVNSREERYLNGGPRRRMLSTEDQSFRHSLMKFPVFKTDLKLSRSSIHNISPLPSWSIPTGALLHFKFLSDFSDRVQKAIEYGQHYQGGIEYKKYAEAIANGSLRTMMFDGSRYMESVSDLIAAGVVTRITGLSRRDG